MSFLGTLAAAAPTVPTGIPTGVAVAAVNPETQQQIIKAAGMQLDVTTLIAIAAFLISLATIIWKTSADSAQRKAFETYSNQRDAERNKYREDFERAVDTRFAGMGATNTLCQTQIAELRERLVGNYMTKNEIADIERRVTDNQGRILDHLERLDTRLHDLSGKVMEALNKK